MTGGGMPDRPVPLYEAVTDENGVFDFPELPAGEYIVHVRAEGYAELDARVSLPPGVEVRRDYFLRPLNAEPAILEGFVREATSSTDIGGPIPGAEVVLVMMRVTNGVHYMLPGMYRTFTDENGYYRFEGIEPTLYHVAISASGYEPFFGQIELLPGQELQQDYVLRPSTVRPGRVCGTVMSPTGPLSGARVTIPLAGLVLAAETDDAGAYCIDSVPAGLHRVTARKDGYVSQTIVVEVPNGGTATADFLLEPGPIPGTAVFAGIVLTATDGSAVPDPVAVPVEGALVRMSLIDPPTFAPVIYETETDSEGRFRIEDIFAPGLYTVSVSARECGSIWDQVFLEAGDDAFREYVLPCHIPGPAAMEGRVAADIPGWVGPILPPIAGAVVRLVPTFDVAPVPLYEATTDETGHYAIGGIQPGLYDVSVTADGYVPGADMVNFGPGETVVRNYDLKPVEVSPGSVSGRVIVNTTYRVVMPVAGARLTLNVPGGPVIASATSGDEGFFTIRGVPPGSYMLRAEAKDFYPENRPVAVLPGENTDAVLRLLRFTTHVGELQGVATWLISNATLDIPEPAGLPIPVANQPVTLVSIEYSFPEEYPPILLEGKTSPAGEFRFPIVPAGRYNLTVGWSGTGSYAQEVTIPEGETTSVSVEVPAPPAILSVLGGRVLSGNSTDMKGVEGALVRLVPDGVVLPAIFPPPSFGLDAITDASGAYRIGRIPPGAYNAVVVAEGFNPGHAALGFRPGEEKRHNFFLEPVVPPPGSGTVRGTVSEDTGVLDVFIPIPDALVTLSGPAGTARTAMSGPGGEYLISDVREGSYRITAEKADYMMQQKDVTVLAGEEAWVNFSLLPAVQPMRVGN